MSRNSIRTIVWSVVRYVSASGESNQVTRRVGTVVSDLHFVFRACSKMLSGDGIMGKASGEVAVGGYTATQIPESGCSNWELIPRRWNAGSPMFPIGTWT